MNIALIIAGGTGQRMQQEIPKQFLNVYDKPIIIYTLETFQRHPDINAIAVVCLDGWHDILKAYAKQFGINKLESIISGGETGQASICNGVYALKEKYCDNDIVLIHDAIRPMVSEEIISDCIQVCQKYGNATTVIPAVEAMLVTNDGLSSSSQYKREHLKRTQTPQAFHIGELASAHKEALEIGITMSIASCTLFVELNKKVFFSIGSEKNIKLTTPDDIEIFKSLINSKKSNRYKND